MRTYGPRSTSKKGKEKEYRNRVSTEWDIRCTLHSDNHEEELHKILESIQCNIDRLHYALVGGLEYNSQDQTHVHIALIFKNNQSRHAALLTLQREYIKGEYAVPRNTNYSYIGWKLHHCKEETKLNTNYLVYEYGSLPKEQLTVHQWKTCCRYGYTGPRPVVQRQLPDDYKPVQKIVPKKVDHRGGDRHINRMRTRPVGRQLTEDKINAARQRLECYRMMLNDPFVELEHSRITEIISRIRNDYNI